MFEKSKGYEKCLGLFFGRDENIARKLINSIQLHFGIEREQQR